MAMNVSHKQLVAFVQVAHSTTFAEAAEKSDTAKPALSIAIKKLEQQLGGKLFSRSTRKVQLSPEGEEFLPVALRLLNDWDDAMADMNNLFAMRRGKLTIAAMPSFANSILPQLLQAFHLDWKNINFGILDVVMESVIQLVREGRAELGFTFETEKLDGLEFHSLFEDRFIALIPPQNELSELQSITWEELAKNDFIAMNRGSTVRGWLDDYVTEAGIELNIVLEAGQLSTIGQFVKHQMGVSVVPGICEQQMTDKGLVCLPISDSKLVKSLGMIKVSRKSLSVPAQAFWNAVPEIKLGHFSEL